MPRATHAELLTVQPQTRHQHEELSRLAASQSEALIRSHHYSNMERMAAKSGPLKKLNLKSSFSCYHPTTFPISKCPSSPFAKRSTSIRLGASEELLIFPENLCFTEQVLHWKV
jgi:hypothetical protein